MLGGTFDPPHLGHLVVADQVYSALGLDEVILVPANQPVAEGRVAGDHARRSPSGHDPGRRRVGRGLSVSANRAGARRGPSYTSVTLDALSEQQPDAEWLVIVGADAAAGLDTWHNHERLRDQATIVVVNRPGADFQPPTGWRWELVEIPSISISGTGPASPGGPGQLDPVPDPRARWST